MKDDLFMFMYEMGYTLEDLKEGIEWIRARLTDTDNEQERYCQEVALDVLGLAVDALEEEEGR